MAGGVGIWAGSAPSGYRQWQSVVNTLMKPTVPKKGIFLISCFPLWAVLHGINYKTSLRSTLTFSSALIRPLNALIDCFLLFIESAIIFLNVTKLASGVSS
jgi:hypothetical protein